MLEFIKKYKVKIIISVIILLVALSVGVYFYIKSERYALNQVPTRDELLKSGKLEEYYNKYLNQALKYGEQGDYQKAIIEYEKLLKINPQSEVGWNNLADIYIKADQYDKAEQAYLGALNLRLEPYIFQKLLELYYSQMKEITKAKIFFEEVYKNNQTYSIALVGANFYREINDFTNAYKYYKIASDMQPNDQNLKETMLWAKKKMEEQKFKIQ